MVIISHVIFEETGLPSGTSWSVTLDSTVHTSTSSTMVLGGVLGQSYDFTIGAVSGYTASPSSGTISGGHGTTITFTATSSNNITFTESGLPSGTSWSVTYNNTTTTSTTSSITFTYVSGASFTINPVTGYIASTSSGTPSSAESINITFSRPSVTFIASNLPSWATSWSIQGVDWNYNSSASTTTNSVTLTDIPAGDNISYEAIAYYGTEKGDYTANGGINNVTTDTTITINFEQFWSILNFSETGLPSGTEWSAKVIQSDNYYSGTGTSTSSTLTLIPDYPSLNWNFIIYPPNGYNPSPNSGIATNFPSTTNISFSSVSVKSYNSSSSTNYPVLLNVGTYPVLYYDSLTLSNNLSSSTPQPYTTQIAINTSNYSSYLNANLSNANIQDGNGNILPSKIVSSTSSTSVIYSVTLPNGIPANTTTTIHYCFYPLNANLFTFNYNSFPTLSESSLRVTEPTINKNDITNDNSKSIPSLMPDKWW